MSGSTTAENLRAASELLDQLQWLLGLLVGLAGSYLTYRLNERSGRKNRVREDAKQLLELLYRHNDWLNYEAVNRSFFPPERRGLMADLTSSPHRVFEPVSRKQLKRLAQDRLPTPIQELVGKYFDAAEKYLDAAQAYAAAAPSSGTAGFDEPYWDAAGQEGEEEHAAFMQARFDSSQAFRELRQLLLEELG